MRGSPKGRVRDAIRFVGGIEQDHQFWPIHHPGGLNVAGPTWSLSEG